jgi:phosphotransferase system HPr (HPr) family protein
VAERALWVTGRLGLHARAAANLVRVANQFQSDITLKRLDNSVEADAKSILSILMLAASRGTELRVLAAGSDEQAAVEAVFDLFVRNFDERVLTESRETDTKEEIRCKGLRVRGVVIGRVLRLQDGTRDVYRAEIEESELERERRRFVRRSLIPAST